VSRVLSLLVRNWPLRLGAIALSLVLYAGLVVAQNARVWPGQVPITPIHQPPGTFLLNGLGDVTSIRYLAPVDVQSQVTNASFIATADLSGVGSYPGGAPVSVPVTVVAPDKRIQVLGWTPPTVVATLDPVITRDIPVRVDRGTVPAGLTAGEPSVDRTTVTARGASSLVGQISAAVARVSIDASGINVDGNVDLVAVDDKGDAVAPVNLEPATVHVKILVGQQLSSRTVAIVPAVTGTLAEGYAVRDVQVDPLTATVSGTQAVIGALDSIATAPIDVTNRTTDLTATVALDPPDNVTIDGSGQVRVRVRVIAESGSRSFGAGLQLAGTRSDLTYRLSVPDVLVTLGGTQAALAAVDPASLAAIADVGGLDAGASSVLVRFQAPPGTTLVAITPARVTVTVVVPATPTPSPSPTPAPSPSESPAI